MMKWLAVLSSILLLIGCCNGTGPGPRAAADVEQNQQVVTAQIS